MKRIFQCDERKAIVNNEAHGVTFREAELVFDDPQHTIALNRFPGEERLEAVGLVQGTMILVVIHKVIDEDTAEEVTRIISARRADRPEREDTGRIVRYEAGRVLSPDERTAHLERLTALGDMRDEDIDYSDIPPITEEHFREMIHGPWLPLEKHTVTLRLDAEVVAWLEGDGRKQAYLINLLLKREAQRGKRRRVGGADAPMEKAS